jgi:glyoxylase-like metal-dependent hydrolase (beta-lactamase superfamily II)
MSTPEWLRFLERKLPSANSVLLRTQRPILIDTGFGSDAGATLDLLRQAGVAPAGLSLVVNTHSHCDHVGGNALLQEQFDCRIAAHAIDAQLVNDRDPSACDSAYLDQPIAPYRVDLALQEGDEIDAGETTLTVVTTPGHARGRPAPAA